MNEVSDFIIFIGRFHPLIVHLPIGFIMFAFILEILSKWKNLKELKTAIPYALLFGAITAAKACLLGYMLASSGEYDGTMLDNHFWFGIATTVFTFIAWLISNNTIKFIKLDGFKANIAALTFLVVLISVTGHYGGNLTHGSDYLTKYAPFTEKPVAITPPKTVNEVLLYQHVIRPILEEKCTSCHNESKKKGGLALSSTEAILKGGREGLALVHGDLEQSGMFHRVTLNPHDKEFMPPDGKTPLTEEEVNLLRFWIQSNDTNFSMKLVDANEKDEILKTALSYLNLGDAAKESLPTVKPVDSLLIEQLTRKGFKLRELVYNAHIYDVVLPNKTSENEQQTNEYIQELAKMKDNIFWLSLQENHVVDSHLETIKQFSNTRQLLLNKNKITDNGISVLKTMPKLQTLNLYKTSISDGVFKEISEMKALKNIYLWNTKVTKDKVAAFKKEHENIKVVLGI